MRKQRDASIWAAARSKMLLRSRRVAASFKRSRIWWNWQTRYFEVVVPKGVQVQVLLCAPFFLSKLRKSVLLTQFRHKKWLKLIPRK